MPIRKIRMRPACAKGHGQVSRRAIDRFLDQVARDIYCVCGSRLEQDTDLITGVLLERCPRCRIGRPRRYHDGLAALREEAGVRP